jgi:hypothetical protein
MTLYIIIGIVCFILGNITGALLVALGLAKAGYIVEDGDLVRKDNDKGK